MVDFPLVSLARLVHESVDGFRGGVEEGDQAVCLRGLAGFGEGHGVVGIFDHCRSDKTSCGIGLEPCGSPVPRVSSSVLRGTGRVG